MMAVLVWFFFFYLVYLYNSCTIFGLHVVLSEADYSAFPKMKRKVAKVGQLRLSPNEETMLLKEEYERRRKLRLQQVCLWFCVLFYLVV